MMNYPIIETIIFILLISFSAYKNNKNNKPLFEMNIYIIIFIIVYLIILYRFIKTIA